MVIANLARQTQEWNPEEFQESKEFLATLKIPWFFVAKLCRIRWNSKQRCKKLQMLQIYLCFLAIFGSFLAIFVFLVHFGSFLAIFGSFLAIFVFLVQFGQFWVILGHFWAIFGANFLLQICLCSIQITFCNSDSKEYAK